MHTSSNAPAPAEFAAYDYSNAGWPRDFDIRIEVAEQQEIVRGALPSESAALMRAAALRARRAVAR